MDVPQIIAGRFRTEREIGRGGMGTVYLASQLGLERPVAVKILKAEFAAAPAVSERFMHEARTMSKLRHARAAIIFDAGRLEDGRPFIVMEHVAGATLEATLKQEKRLSPERAVRVACEICDVLAEAHRLNIVHRDLKPSNIMLTERGVCVLDFGIAKVLTATAELSQPQTTESGLIIGTPRYMSPEQCMGQKVTQASDLYSLGVLLYEMLSGRTPFIDQMPSAVLVKQAVTQPPPLESVCSDAKLPRALTNAVHLLLAKNPADRPKTAAGTRALLEQSLLARSSFSRRNDSLRTASEKLSDETLTRTSRRVFGSASQPSRGGDANANENVVDYYNDASPSQYTGEIFAATFASLKNGQRAFRRTALMLTLSFTLVGAFSFVVFKRAKAEAAAALTNITNNPAATLPAAASTRTARTTRGRQSSQQRRQTRP